MTSESIQLIRRAMAQRPWAEAAFGRLSGAELDKEYGQRGETCREILTQYREFRAAWETAMKELETLLGASR